MLAGRVALVTGGAAGIGQAIVKRMVTLGARVVIGDHSDCEPARYGGPVVTQVADVQDPQAMVDAVAAAEKHFGGLDILVNAAGLFAGLTPTRFEAIERSEWRRVMEVNLFGAMNACQAALPALCRSGSGRIINIASTTVHEGAPGMAHYAASKGALIAVTRCLARELGVHGVTANAVAPGLTLSRHLLDRDLLSDPGAEAMRLRRSVPRHQTPDDVSGVVCFLASVDAAMISGQTLVVDGGGVFT